MARRKTLSRKKQSAGGVNTSGRSVIMDSFMSDVKKKLRQNEYKEVKSSGTSSVWTSFMQIMDKDNKKVSAVKCITCDALLKFDSAKTGTSHFMRYMKIWDRKWTVTLMLSMKFTLHYNNAHVQSHAHAMFLWQPELAGSCISHPSPTVTASRLLKLE